ncbi:hypothetical protein D9758_010794 [Tetrapyrgos nigripes]|uniref:CCHC-type domain-containing protein n=1 Tax=Tetrapyrgos nigripes TaxID=182062 RepID=A0A8H5D6B4_9AGAR|nr:hypothetical protein D9758_010794 [Tetrapyrgos nigripes]
MDPWSYDRDFVCTHRWVWKLEPGDVILSVYSYIRVTLDLDLNTEETVVRITGPLFFRKYNTPTELTDYDPSLPCADRPHIFFKLRVLDCNYNSESPKPYTFCENQPCLNQYNTQTLPETETLPIECQVVTHNQELSIIDSKTEPEQGTSTPTNTQPNPEPSSLVPPDPSSASDLLPDPPSNNPSTPPRNPSPNPSDLEEPSSPAIPSNEGPSVAPRHPNPSPSPDPSDPGKPAMSDVAPNNSNSTSKRGRKPDAFNGECDEASGEKGGDWATQRITEREEDEEDTKLKEGERRWTTLKEIKNTRMKGTDISSYNSIFDTYGEESDYGETALLDFYKAGLPRDLRKSVAGTWPKWKDFDEYRERAMDLHLEWINKREKEGRSRPFPTPRTSAGPSQGRTVANVNALMNMGPGANSSFTPLPKLTTEERDRLWKLGACFACRQPGHMSNECPTFPNNTPRTAETSAPSLSSDSPPVTVAQMSSLSTSRNVIKDISDMVNKVKGLEGEEKEQAAVYLKDIMSKLDF